MDYEIDAVYNIVSDLEAESSTNGKLEILKANVSNRILRQFFLMALNPHMTFGIKQIPAYEPGHLNLILPEAMADLMKFVRRELTGNAAIEHLKYILSCLPMRHAELIERIIKKDPMCGVQAKNVNKVWKNLIPETPYMRCSSANDKNYNRITYPAIVQKKANGVFLNVIIRNNTVEVQSRNGKVLELHGCLDHMANLIPKRDFVVHSEGLVLREGRKFDDASPFEDRKTGNGIINKAIQGTISIEEARNIVIVAWDLVPYDDWTKGKCDVTYDKRWKVLTEAYFSAKLEKLWIVEWRSVYNFKEAAKFYNKMLAQGEEGAVLKNYSGIWKNHTSPDQVKMKVKDPADLLCVGTTPHLKKEGWIGALVLESADGIIKVKTGSGLTEADRQKDPSEYIGKIIELEYNEITDDKSTGQKSLFLPIYVGIRADKDVADDYETILERSTYGKGKK